MSSQFVYPPTEILNAHYAPNKISNDLWGLAIFKNNEYFVTCGDDGQIRIYS